MFEKIINIEEGYFYKELITLNLSSIPTGSISVTNFVNNLSEGTSLLCTNTTNSSNVLQNNIFLQINDNFIQFEFTYGGNLLESTSGVISFSLTNSSFTENIVVSFPVNIKKKLSADVSVQLNSCNSPSTIFYNVNNILGYNIKITKTLTNTYV